MTEIDFEVDEAELAEGLDNDIPNEEDSLFIMSYFLMPIRFQVNGVELFEYNNDPWVSMPLLNIASCGLITVKDLKLSKKENFSLLEGPGYIEFTMIDDENVKIVYDYFPKPVILTVKYAELLEAFQKFAEKVRAFLKERVPQLNEHPYWGPWLRGEKD